MDVRRVVTGHDEGGKAVFVIDEAVEPDTVALSPGSEFHRIWGADSTVHFPNDGSPPSSARYFPPVGGFRFGLFTIPPDASAGIPPDLDLKAAFAEMEAKLPGMADHLERGAPGMHTTATVDYEYVVSGTPTLELDDGAMVALQPGDTVVQNGTRHRWANPGDVPAVMVVVLVGAEHDNVD